MKEEDVIICFCAGITKHQIELSAEAEELSDLYCMGMSQYCGSCRPDVEEILENFEEKCKKEKCGV